MFSCLSAVQLHWQSLSRRAVPRSDLLPVTLASRPQGTLASESLALKPNKKLFIDTQMYVQQFKSLIFVFYGAPT